MTLDFPTPSIWVEGVGNMVRGLTWFTGTYPNNGTWNELLCMKQHGQWIYHHTTGWRSSTFLIPACDSLQTLNQTPSQGIESVRSNNGVSFYPNPVHGASHLTIKDAGKFELLDIYNITGVKCFTMKMENRVDVLIDRKDFVPGLYVYRLSAKTGYVVNGRFMVE